MSKFDEMANKVWVELSREDAEWLRELSRRYTACRTAKRIVAATMDALDRKSLNRFEVISHREDAKTWGREMVIYDDDLQVAIDYQDDGRTMKIFLGPYQPPTTPEHLRDAVQWFQRERPTAGGHVGSPPDCERLPDCLCCRCAQARIEAGEFPEYGDTHPSMVLVYVAGFACRKCGNKRCPHHEWHGFKCTNSNELDQVGERSP